MGAKMYDNELAKVANIQLKTKHINKNTDAIVAASPRRDDYLKLFRILDEQDAVNRYRWFNIPAELSSQEIERMLYYRGQLCFFYYEALDKFFFMPYALDGSLDFYGRYNEIHPVPWCASEEAKLKDDYKLKEKILSEIKLTVRYDVVDEDELTEDEIKKSAVILWDYTKQRGELNIPRQALNEAVLCSMADIMSYLDTALLIGSGVEGYRVENGAAKDEVKQLAGAIYKSAINKTPYVAVTGQINFQELSAGSKKYAVSDFLMAFQGIDNFRLSTYGISNGGIYEKQAHVLEKEVEINNSNMYSAEQDGTKLRQRFCNIVNSIFGSSMWCEPSEAVLGYDVDGDGFDYDREVDEENQQEGGDQDGNE